MLTRCMGRRASFMALPQWLDKVSARRSNPQTQMQGIIVATKSDLPLTRHEVRLHAL